MNKAEQARLVAWRLRVLRHAIDGGNVGATCRYFGLSRKTFFKWKGRLATLGEAGLCDRPRTPRRSPRATPAVVVSKVLYLRQQYHFGPTKDRGHLKRFHELSICGNTVHRLLIKHGLNRLPGSQKHRSHAKRWQRYEKPQPGHRLQMDVKFVERIPGTRKRLYLFTAIDDCTRIRVLKVHDACNQRTAVQFVDEVLKRLPFPVHVVQTDNGLSQKSRTQSFAKLADSQRRETTSRRFPPYRRDALTIVTEGRAPCARPVRASYSVANPGGRSAHYLRGRR